MPFYFVPSDRHSVFISISFILCHSVSSHFIMFCNDWFGILFCFKLLYFISFPLVVFHCRLSFQLFMLFYFIPFCFILCQFVLFYLFVYFFVFYFLIFVSSFVSVVIFHFTSFTIVTVIQFDLTFIYFYFSLLYFFNILLHYTQFWNILFNSYSSHSPLSHCLVLAMLILSCRY